MSAGRPALSLSFLVPLLALSACGTMAIDGEVVDARGKPIPGARVAAMGSSAPCMGAVGEDGRFELPCALGSYTVVLSAEGYTSEEVAIEATERKRYDIGKKILVKIPEEKGLFIFSENAYIEMTPGRLKRVIEKEGKTTQRAMCVDAEKSNPNEIQAGVQAFFDYDHPGWRPFRIDEGGCAYRDTKDADHKWTVKYREKAEFEKRTLNQGKTVVLMKLEKGQYFIADWKGFFIPEDKKEGRHSYTGYLLNVK